MSDDDNYTTDESDEPGVEGPVEPDGTPVDRDAIAIGVLVLGLITIAASAFCSTVQQDFQETTPPGKATFFVTALALPLSIAGALLTVVGVCVLAFRIRPTRRGG